MADNFAKLWVQKNLNQTAINRAQQAINSLGRALPCRVTAVDGAIVTVAFEVNATPWTIPEITIPKAESPWIRMPTQAGDKGITMPADVYLGGVSGLGGGVANMSRPSNLSALVFVPISNANSDPIDPDAAQIEGPNGAIIRTTEGTTCSIVANQSGITLTFGANSVVIDASGIHFTGPVTGTSTATFQGEGTFSGSHTVSAHKHGGVQTGGGQTETPTG